MLPAEDKASYSRVKDALKTQFRSVDIEELRGMEFHRLVQTSESVEELGMEIQRLGHRAFPSVTGNDLDRLLKGRFFQALLVRWQRKLGAPKVEETFQELFDRARMTEQREKQYAESAALHGNNDGNKQKNNKEKVTKFSSRPGRSYYGKPGQFQPSGSQVEKPTSNNCSSRYTPPLRTCYLCQQPGHIARECPRRSRDSEAHGRVQKAARTATLESKSQCEVPSKPEDLSTHELENILAQRHLSEGQHLTDVSMKVVSSSVQCVETEAVGSTLCLQVSVE